MSDPVKREMEDFKNLQFTGKSIYWEDMSKEFLIKVLVEWTQSILDLTWGPGSYHEQIAKRFGWDAAVEIARETSEMYARKHVPNYAKIAGIETNNIVDCMKTVFLSPDGGTLSRAVLPEELRDKIIGSMFETKHPDHLKATVKWCPLADNFKRILKEMGFEDEEADEMIKKQCAMDAGLGGTYFEACMPGKKVKSTLVKAPSIKDPARAPACIMEWEVIEQ